MKKIAFVITNPNHHWDMIRPILVELKKIRSIYPVVISFCELRRMITPKVEIAKLNLPFKIMPGFAFMGLKPSSSTWILGNSAGIFRRLAQEMTWHLLLKRPFQKSLSGISELVVLNDSVFPGNYVVKEAKKKDIRTSLLQEGIRFPLPTELNNGNIYGGNVDRIFTWGLKSKEYFTRRINTPVTEIIAAGCPRIDLKIRKIESLNYEITEGRQKKNKILIFFSNPIDDQGFTSEIEKWELIADFFNKSKPVLSKNNILSWIKLHPRENIDNFVAVLRNRNLDQGVSIKHGDAFSLLSQADYSVIIASTVGLESLMLKVPLGVIKIPGHGYAFDYVLEKAGIPLDMSDDNFYDCLNRLIQKSGIDMDQEKYISSHFANRGSSSKYISKKLSLK